MPKVAERFILFSASAATILEGATYALAELRGVSTTPGPTWRDSLTSDGAQSAAIGIYLSYLRRIEDYRNVRNPKLFVQIPSFLGSIVKPTHASMINRVFARGWTAGGAHVPVEWSPRCGQQSRGDAESRHCVAELKPIDESIQDQPTNYR